MKHLGYGVVLNLEDVKKKLTKMYDGKPNGCSMEREMFVHKSYCNYGELGAVFFALNGSPPKGYAVFVPEHRYIVFIDAFGKCRKMKDVIKIEGVEND